MAVFGPINATALAQSIPVPRVKPVPEGNSQILSQTDAQNFRMGMRAADQNGWDDVARYRGRIKDPIARDVLIWRLAVRTNEVSLAEITGLMSRHPDWPRMITIRARAERMLFEDPMSPQRTLQWFQSLPAEFQDPASGEGRAALARAYFGVGDERNGLIWLRKAWRDSRLTRDRQKELFAQYGGKLTRDDHAARADHLIWLGSRYYSSAEALLPFMNTSDRKLADARIRVGANRSGMDRAIDALSPAQARDTGLLFERARWRRKRKTKDYALPVYLEISAPASTDQGKDRLWTERKIMAYWLISENRFAEAYQMITPHGLKEGLAFAEAEFLAGWLSLRKLNQPQRAKMHFDRLRGGVSTPVSVGRAAYWQGRAESALGLPAAQARYAEAASHPNTFYGQLAIQASGTGRSTLSLPPEPGADHMRAQFEAKPIVRALRMIGETGNELVFRQFSYQLDGDVSQSGELTLLADLAKDYHFYSPSVRAGKQGGRVDALMTESSYPIPDVMRRLGPGYDLPFVLAIARQESEFATTAISHARAYGMMQMIDSTANATARRHRVPYSQSRLITDQDYSAMLGALHLKDLLEKYNGNYIMVAAAYNAGPTRVSQWVEKYGDPRSGSIDPVDWVESLPFSETRNYIQRVMENQQVYRARLNNNQSVLTLRQDLARSF